MNINEIKAKAMILNEDYAVCYAYGTEAQKTNTAIKFADYAAEILPQLLSEVDHLTAELSDKDAIIASLAERIAEVSAWADAEKDGWLVVLPCKTGTTVYRVKNGEVDTPYIIPAISKLEAERSSGSD